MLRIKEWSSYQSYKDRKPPWIRLQKSLLDNYKFQSMSAEARALLPMLWLLASEDEDPVSGLLRDGYEVIAFRLRMDLKNFETALLEIINSDFIEVVKSVADTACNETVTNPYPDRNQSVTPETETETETETERGSPFSEAVEFYNALARECGLTQVQKLTKQRKASLTNRLKDAGGLGGWRAALEKLRESSFCMGENDKGWKADFDFILQEKSFTKLMEGAYDNGKPKTKGGANDELRQFLGRARS